MNTSHDSKRRTRLVQFVTALFRESPKRAVIAGLVTFGLGLTEGAGLLLLAPLLQLVGVDMGAESSAVGRLSTAAADAFAYFGVHPTLAIVLDVYVLIVTAQAALQSVQMVLGSEVQEMMTTAMRIRVYEAIASMRWPAFVSRRASDFAHILTDEVDRVGMAFYVFLDVLVTGLVCAAYVALAIRISPGLTLVVLASGGVVAWLSRIYIRHAPRAGARLSLTRAAMYAAIVEHFGGMKAAKANNMVAGHLASFRELAEDLGQQGEDLTRNRAALMRYTMIGSAIVLALLVYTSRIYLEMPTASLLLLMFLFARLMPRLTGLLERVRSFLTLLPSYERVIEFEQRCLESAEPPVRADRLIDLTTAVEFQRVTFAYEGGARPAVSELSLVIRAGATTAIVGPSGGGKSTVADLLMGLLEPDSGRVLVDGVALDADGLRAWRERIGYVTQDTILFHDSIRANLLWARPDATEADLWAALEAASAEEFVAHLPRGLDTIVGDRGVLVSGGERQRLSLARALLRKPAVLVLDEATSALDAENAARIQRALDRLHHRLTVVVITHRLASVQDADTIYVIERGRLVESGDWRTLMTRERGRFVDLWDAQHGGNDTSTDTEVGANA